MALNHEKKWISNIIWMFLFLHPIFDVCTSFSIHFFGRSSYIILGIKFFFLLFLIALNLFHHNKKIFWYFLFLFVYFGCFFFFSKSFSLSILFLEAQNLFRTFYLPMMLVSLFFLHQRQLFSISKSYFSYLLGFYLCFLVVPELLNLGFNSYAHSKVGGVGWFYSTNEIGGILAILGPFYLKNLLTFNWIRKVFGFLFYLLGIFVLGTKVPILAFIITIGIFFLALLKKLWKSKKWHQLIITCVSSILLFFVFCGVMVSSSFYKNIKIHLDFLEIYQVSDLFTYHHIDHFIFSERLSFLKNTHNVYVSSSFSQKILGIGIMEHSDVAQSRKMIEMDYFDIFYHYGILGVCFFFLPFFFFSWKRKFCLEEKISIFLIFLLSFFSGHILVSPSVSVFVSLILLPKKEEEI